MRLLPETSLILALAVVLSSTTATYREIRSDDSSSLYRIVGPNAQRQYVYQNLNSGERLVLEMTSTPPKGGTRGGMVFRTPAHYTNVLDAQPAALDLKALFAAPLRDLNSGTVDIVYEDIRSTETLHLLMQILNLRTKGRQTWKSVEEITLSKSLRNLVEWENKAWNLFGRSDLGRALFKLASTRGAQGFDYVTVSLPSDGRLPSVNVTVERSTGRVQAGQSRRVWRPDEIGSQKGKKPAWI